MQVQVIFTAHGSSTATGNFAPGDMLRCSAEQARHLVEEAGCARYAVAEVQTPAPSDQPAEVPTLAAKRTRRTTGA